MDELEKRALAYASLFSDSIPGHPIFSKRVAAYIAGAKDERARILTDEEAELSAKAMFACTNPNGATSGYLSADLGDGAALELDLDLDWRMNRDTYITLARAAYSALMAHRAKEGG